MKKRAMSLLLVLCMVISMLPATVFAAGTQNSTEAVEAETSPFQNLSDAAEQGSEQPANPFADVKESDWFYHAVQYARANGFFSGTSETTFAPDGTMTRGMFVTVLAGMAGVKAEDYKGETVFSDVTADAYYAPYVAWASKYGVTGGTGDGKFSPNALIDRQQMATFFVKYFEVFDVDYDTGVNVTAAPKDLDSVAPWAQEAVLKLWSKGLMAGDGESFNPTGSASRAQAAAVCMTADKSVKTWYSEPGVESERVSVDPAAGGEAVIPDEKPNSGKPSGGSSGNSGSTTTSYYVEFLSGSGQSTTGVTFPTSQTYAKDTLINQLPTPTVPQGTFFLGWYYDEALNTPVGVGDCVTRATKLYAKFVSGEQVVPMETPNYITQSNVAVNTSYTFKVGGVSGNIADAIKFINITGGNTAVSYTLNGSTVSAALEAGQTYQVELTKDAAYFILNGVEQSTSVRYLNILTAKAETKKATLNEDLSVNDASTVEGLNDAVFDGLYQTDGQGNTRTNTTTGTFVSSTAYAVGETVAFTRGEVDLEDVSSETGDVAYLKIVGVTGPSDGKYTYSYEMADVEDVLFMPDTLPISETDDTDGDTGNNSIAVPSTAITAALTQVEAASVDEGDYIAFYSGALNGNSTRVVQYAKITEVDINEEGDGYIIAYTPYLSEDAYNAALSADLDVYYEKNKDIDLTEAEEAELRAALVQDMQNSGYVEQAAMYMAAMMMESGNLEELPDAERINEIMSTMDLTALPTGDGFALAGGSARVTFNWEQVNIDLYKNLKKLDANGFGVGVRVPFTIKLNDKVSIDVVAEFQEEVVLKQKISTKRHKIGFLKYDYSLNASFEVGNYTGIDFSATVHTDNDTSATEALGKRLESILTVIKSQSEGINTGTGMDDLSKAYEDLMKSAGDNWVDIIDQQLFCSEGNAFLHIFCWQIKGSFVVSVNLNVAMGMNFEYITHKQYNYSVRVKARTATNETIDLVPARYGFDFYVMGTLALRAGLRLEMYVGLFSLKLDKIGITAEAGAYVQLWGYFFYHKEWAENLGTSSNSAGAMLVEIGIYIDIKFVAQLFSSNKLTYNPTLYAHQWPLWSAGEVKNVYAFANTDDTSYEFKTVKTLTLPASTYLMKAMDLKTGKISNESRDDTSESSFEISFTNNAFSYNAATNTVTVTPPAGSLNESADMYIDWEKAPLTFTTAPIQKVIRLTWSDPQGMRYISFDSMGGSAVEGLSAGSGGAITWPANPTRVGYTFVDWYTDRECTTAYTGSKTEMPTFAEGTKGMTLYAGWTANTVDYMVEHYWQKLGGGYETEYQGKSGTVDTTTVNSAKIETGFAAKPFEEQTIAADGSTVVKVYYDRVKYDVLFHDGDTGAENITMTYVYGAPLSAPNMSREGHTFTGWNTEQDGSGSPLNADAKVTGAVTYYAQWNVNKYTVTWMDREGNVLEIDKNVPYGTTPSYNSLIPTKDGSAACTYEFHSWNTKMDGKGTKLTDSTKVTDHVTFYILYTCKMNKYTVIWENDNGTELEKDENVVWGEKPSYDGDAPTKEPDAQYSYDFIGWWNDSNSNQVRDKGEFFEAGSEFPVVVGHVTYTAVYDTTGKEYTVTWKNDNGTTLGTNYNVAYGTTPSYGWATPTKAADAQYTYTFAGWWNDSNSNGEQDEGEFFDKESTLPAVMGDVTYTATYTTTVNKYTVTWMNGDTELKSEELDYGAMPNYDGATPTKAADAQYTYTFDKWSPEVSSVTGDVTYTATYTTTVNKYTVIWLDENGTTLETDENVPYGTKPTYNGEIPTKEGSVGHTYVHTGWNTAANGFGSKLTEQTIVTGNVTYYIQWSRSDTEYTVTWMNGEAVLGTISGLYYGNSFAYTGAVPTKEATEQYTYTFAGWNTDPDGSGTDWTSESTVTGDMTYYAQYSETTRKYKVTFMRGDTILEVKEVEYNKTTNCPIAPTGYRRTAWTSNPDGTGERWTANTKITEDKTYYTQWVLPVWVGGEQFEEGKLTIAGNGGGTATYDPATYTLTLDNFKWEGTVDPRSEETGLSAVIEIGYFAHDNSYVSMTVVLEGENIITNTSTAPISAGLSTDANLTIQGSGSLIAAGGPGSNFSAGIYVRADRMTVESGTITVQANSSASAGYGIYGINRSNFVADVALAIAGGSVAAIAVPAADAENQSWGTGIRCNISLTGGTLLCRGGKYATDGNTTTIPLAGSFIVVKSLNYNGTDSTEETITDDNYREYNNYDVKWLQFSPVTTTDEST